MKFFPVLPLAALFVFFASCSARIEGRLDPGGSANFTAAVSLEPRTSALIRRLSGRLNSGGDQGPVLDGKSITESLLRSPGVRAAALINSSPSALEGTIGISRIGDLLAAAEGEDPVITWLETGGVLISLKREGGPALLSLFSEEAVDYLSSLMAPIATGEVLDRREYLELVRSIYGAGVAEEIGASRIRLSLRCP
ncbi:MAG: hypothetical protein LBL43_07000, partial [Treponema sp.]|nr:hypothetical protein [Treponema sp.]